MLEPRRTKYKKQQKGKNRGEATRNNRISFGEYGLQATGRCRITSRQIEAARKAIKRHVRRGGKLWIRVFPDKPYSSKPLEVRMGKGKGNVDYWAQPIKPGTMLFEIEGVPKELAKEAMRRAAGKLPVSTAFVEK